MGGLLPKHGVSDSGEVAQELLARAEEGAGRIALHSACFLNGSLFPEVYRPRFIQKVLASPLGGWIGPRIPRRMVEKVIRGLFGPDTQPSGEDLETSGRSSTAARGGASRTSCRA